jgi:hypothetical protein
MNQLYYILYVSVASGHMNDEDLDKILSKSRKNNQDRGLTGVLLFGQGRFIQLLEGHREVVDSTFSVIRLDSRHLDITVIASGNVGKRCFPEWFMGFKAIRPDTYAAMEGFVDLTKKSIENDDCELPVKLLRSFVRKNRLDAT